MTEFYKYVQKRRNQNQSHTKCQSTASNQLLGLLKGNIKGQVKKKQKINSRTLDNVLRLLCIKQRDYSLGGGGSLVAKSCPAALRPHGL